MHTINIFLASPFDMNYWRPIIGDLIRRWNDLSEPHGYRLKLLCWEDFMPEFTGVRKQTEYNEQLIKNSNILIALFDSGCGKYTHEEIDYAKNIGLKHIHFLVKAADDTSPQLNTYLKSENYPTAIFATPNELAYHIGIIVKDYINTLPVPKHKRSIDDVRNIYATFSNDWRNLAPEIGNAIRMLDYIVDSRIGMRAKLLENDRKNLDSCHYYMGFINSSLSDNEREEIHHAVDNTSHDNCLSHSILYFKRKEEFLGNDNDICHLLTRKEIFSEQYESIYKIKWNLLIWFLHEALNDVDKHCGLKFDNNWITFMDFPIIPTESLGITFDSTWDENRKLIFLLAEINRRYIALKCSELGDGDSPLDFDNIAEQIGIIENNHVLTEKLMHDSIDSINHLLDKVNARIDTLELNADNAGELFKLNIFRERLLENLIEYDPAVAPDLLSTKLFSTSLYDNFAETIHSENYNQDIQYLNIIEFADSHRLHSPVIEMQRMNYANYLIRHNYPSEAIQHYESARLNLNNFNINAPLFAQYSFALYVNYIHTLIGLGLTEKALLIIQELEQKIDIWNKSNILGTLHEVYNICLYVSKLRCGVENNLKKGISLLKKIFDKDFIHKVTEDFYDDIYFHFPNTLAARLLDNLTLEDIYKAIPILNDCYSRIKNETKLDQNLKLFHNGEITHNLALAYNRIGDSIKALGYAKEALYVRGKLYSVNKQDDSLFSIAETIYIISVIYLYKHPLSHSEFTKGLEYANKAIELYSQHSKGYIEHETCIYKAKLAKASLQMRMPYTRQDGIRLITECYNWAISHPDSTYRNTIIEEYNLRIKH